jgi:type I restriction enzyme S subunit
VDGLIAALDKKIAKKRLLKQGTMQQLLTGKKRLPGFTDEWVDTPIGEGVRFQVGYPFQSQYFTSDRIGKRLVKNRDLKSDDQIVFYNGEYDHKFIVHNGDILIGMDGDFLPYKWDKGIALLNQRVGRLLPTKKWDLSFVMYSLIEPLQKLQDGTGATTVKHLSHNDIEQMVLCIPQNYEEQQAIATILSDMDKEIAELEAQRDKYRLLKSGMMQKLLTGQIRLKTE